MRINWQSIGRTNVYNVICADQYFWQLTTTLLRLSSQQIQTFSTRVNPGFYFTAFSIDGTMSGNQKTTMRYSIFLNYLNIWKWIFLRLKNGLHPHFFLTKCCWFRILLFQIWFYLRNNLKCTVNVSMNIVWLQYIKLKICEIKHKLYADIRGMYSFAGSSLKK